MRKEIYELVRMGRRNSTSGKIYDVFITLCVIVSVIPLMFKDPIVWMNKVDIFTAYMLFLDYILRWVTADFKEGKEGKIWPFIRYPFRLPCIFTILSILPSLSILAQEWRVLRILRVAVLFQYSKDLILVTRVFRRQANALYAVLGAVVMYVCSCALLMFNIEPDTFPSFFEALYWATTALTTIGYGDYFPKTVVGQFVSMISSIVGIAIVALPTGILTTGFMEEIRYAREENETKDIEAPGKVFTGQSLVNILLIIGFASLNIILFETAVKLELPLWLDITGTVLAAVLMGPAAGILVGFFNNFFFAMSYGTRAIIFVSVSAVTAIIAGNMLRDRKTGKVKYRAFAHTGILCAAAAGFISALCRMVVGNPIPNSCEEFIKAAIGYTENNELLINGLAASAVKLGDMTCILLILFVICMIAERCNVHIISGINITGSEKPDDNKTDS